MQALARQIRDTFRLLFAQPDEVMLEVGSGGELIAARLRAVIALLLLLLPLVNAASGGSIRETMIGLAGAVFVNVFAQVWLALAHRQRRHRWLPFASSAFDVTAATLGPNNLLTVTESGGGTIHLQFDPGQSFGVTSFNFSISGGSTNLTVACFAAGTRLLGEHGQVAVEALRPGMRLRSAFGGCAPIAWIGHRRIDCARHPRPLDVWPVRVRACRSRPRGERPRTARDRTSAASGAPGTGLAAGRSSGR